MCRPRRGPSFAPGRLCGPIADCRRNAVWDTKGHDPIFPSRTPRGRQPRFLRHRVRRGDDAQAEDLYEQALKVDPAQPEAQYNLGYVMLERGRTELAIRYFRGALASDPRFADAHFNLAMAYEQLGDTTEAKIFWKRYLEIEPTGTWADIARRHL